MKRHVKTYVIIRLKQFARVSLLLVSLWQIEEIWRSLQNGWVYGLPFGLSTSNYWLAHDFWFVVLFLTFLWSEISGIMNRQNIVESFKFGEVSC